MKRALAALLFALGLAAPAGAHMRFIVFTTADHVDSTQASATNIPGLAFTLAASVDVLAHCYLAVRGEVAGSGVIVSLAATGGGAPTSVTGTLIRYETAATPLTTNFTSLAVGSSSTNSLTTRSLYRLDFLIRNDAVARTVTVTADTEVTGDDATIEHGSWCEYSYEYHS